MSLRITNKYGIKWKHKGGKAMSEWNPWHGCTKISDGCLNCYVYRRDEEFGRDASAVKKTGNFDLPRRRRHNGSFVLSPAGGIVYTCFTSDFFHPSADEWREEAWIMMRERKDLKFFLVTKRPDRFYEALIPDWENGYDNVYICCTCENQRMADERLPLFLELPIKHKSIICEPMLERIDLSPYLKQYGEDIEQVTCGGESGSGARIFSYKWALDLREQCMAANVSFRFKQTGSAFEKDGKLFIIKRRDQVAQAAKAGIDFCGAGRDY